MSEDAGISAYDWMKDGGTVESVSECSQTQSGEGRSVLLKTKIIRGIAHPPGEPETYNGLKFTKKELIEKYAKIPGTTVYDDHDLSKPIGKVMASAIGEDGSLCLDVILDESKYPHAKEVMRRIESKNYRGMSLGCRHLYNPKSGHVYSSDVCELSLCPEGALPNTNIYTLASSPDSDSSNPITDIDGNLLGGPDRPFQIKWFDFDNCSDINAQHYDGKEDHQSRGSVFSWVKPNGGGTFSASSGGLHGEGSSGGSVAPSPFPNIGGKFDDPLYMKSRANPFARTTEANPFTATNTTTTAMQQPDAGNECFTTTTTTPTIRPPTPQDPYYRNALGQFASPREAALHNHHTSEEGSEASCHTTYTQFSFF